MGFPKGHKLSGSRKGVPNKTTEEAREILNKALAGQLKHIGPTLEKVRQESPEKYLMLLEKFMSYYIPKRRDITSNDETILAAPIAGVRIIEDGTGSKTPT